MKVKQKFPMNQIWTVSTRPVAFRKHFKESQRINCSLKGIGSMKIYSLWISDQEFLYPTKCQKYWWKSSLCGNSERMKGPWKLFALPIRESLASPGSIAHRMHLLIIKFTDNWKQSNSTDVLASLKTLKKGE